MISPSPLDNAIREALTRLHAVGAKTAFDLERYRQAFAQSAREKAKAVLDALRDKSPFAGKIPVLVSIGGADGEELAYLLQFSSASHGALIEALHPLAEYARHRTPPAGKHIEVFEGDALQQLGQAMEWADGLIRRKEADYKVITCHAVIHELYDRGQMLFDPLDFFAEIFNDDMLPTWFTYREPSVPTTWPDVVLLSALCQSKSLEQLCHAIISKHPSFAALRPKPLLVGNQLRVHSQLGMEVLAKLFYLEDLEHEIEERSTAIDHRIMTNSLVLAIGEQAVSERRAIVQTSRAPSDSFSMLWQKFGIRVLALRDDKSTEPLAIPESHVRLIAWRDISPTLVSTTAIGAPSPGFAEPEMPDDLLLADRALRSADQELLNALLVSNGRAWIEGKHRVRALSLLKTVKDQATPSSLQWLWSYYLLSITGLFSGKGFSLEDFSEELIERVKADSMFHLFRAERMEFARKLGERSVAVQVANDLLSEFGSRSVVLPSSNFERYIRGTCHFLIGNLLRSGGLYREALTHIDLAEQYLRPGISSHDTELAHCYYARSVCYAMQGFANVEPVSSAEPDSFQFANALIRLTYSNAAWFLGDLQIALNYAKEAADAFDAIEAFGYATRARTIAGLLSRWMALEGRNMPAGEGIDTNLNNMIDVIIGQSDDYPTLSNWLAEARPSVALGLLQFCSFGTPRKSTMVSLRLPKLLKFDAEGQLHWIEATKPCNSIADASNQLRTFLRVPRAQKIPLIPD